jgi:hypothetical protein
VINAFGFAFKTGCDIGHRPYADSRVWLTEGREVHNCGHGNVLSSRVPTALGMAAQGPEWLHSGGDGCTGPEVTGETRSSGLMSQHCPAWAWGRCPYPFRGSVVLFRGRGAPAVRERVTQCHGVDTRLTAQRRIAAGMATQGRRLAEQRRGRIPRRCQRAGVARIRS